MFISNKIRLQCTEAGAGPGATGLIYVHNEQKQGCWISRPLPLWKRSSNEQLPLLWGQLNHIGLTNDIDTNANFLNSLYNYDHLIDIFEYMLGILFMSYFTLSHN